MGSRPRRLQHGLALAHVQLAGGLALFVMSACPAIPGGEGDGPTCEIEDPCADVDLDSDAPLLIGGAAPTLTLGSTSLVLGASTRLDVQTTLGFGADVRGNAFRQNHCELGLQLQYVDDTLGDNFDGAPNGDDRLVRVVTLPSTNASLSLAAGADPQSALQAGSPIENAASSLGDPSSTIRARDTTLVYRAAEGVAAFSLGDAVDQLSIFLPTEADAWPLAMTIDSGDLGTVSTRDSTLGELTDLLGPPSAVGIAQSDLLLVDARVATWPAFGIRGAGVCPVFGNCDEDTSITSLLLSFPFMGTGEADLGLWSRKEDVDAHFGSTGTDVDGVTVYSGQTDTGFIYLDAGDCSQRVVGMILDQRVAP